MNILHTAQVEFCLDGSMTMEYLLDTAVSRSFIEYLGSIGRTEYFPHFARPFFRINRSGSFLVKGVEGDTTIQVAYLRPPQGLEDEILSRIRTFQPDNYRQPGSATSA